MENNLIDYVSQLKVRNAAKAFYTISREESQNEAITKIFNGIVSFIEGIEMPKKQRLPPKTSLDIKTIENIVCEYYRMEPSKLHERTRKREICFCRQMVHYIAIEYNISGVVLVGKYYGLDHTTVVHSIKKIKDISDTEEKARLDIYNIKYNISQFLKNL